MTYSVYKQILVNCLQIDDLVFIFEMCRRPKGCLFSVLVSVFPITTCTEVPDIHLLITLACCTHGH